MNLQNYLKKELLKKGMDEIIVVNSEGKSSQIKFVNNKIAKTGTENLINLSLFVTKNKRIVVTSLKTFTKSAADELINKISSFIKKVPKNDDYFGIAKGPFKYKKLKEYYDKVLDINQVDLVEKGINAALNEGAKRSSGILELSEIKNSLLSSNNAETESKSSSLYFSIRSFTEKDASGHSGSVSRVRKKFDTEKAGKEAGKIAKLALNPKTIKSGKYNVVFDPLPFAGLLKDVGISSSAFYVDSGLSFFNGKLRKKVASNIVNLYDDGKVANGLGSNIFDLEGYPTQKTSVIKKGILKNYIHNYSTAKKYKTKSTGNAGLISPTPTNIVLESGKTKRKELFENCIHITNLWYTRFQNYLTGDFSTIPRDGIFLVKNGEIKYPVKNIRVSDNMLNLLKSIVLIANDQRQILSWESELPVFTPSVLVKNLNITKPIV